MHKPNKNIPNNTQGIINIDKKSIKNGDKSLSLKPPVLFTKKIKNKTGKNAPQNFITKLTVDQISFFICKKMSLQLFNRQIFVGEDTNIASNIHCFLCNLTCGHFSILH